MVKKLWPGEDEAPRHWHERVGSIWDEQNKAEAFS